MIKVGVVNWARRAGARAAEVLPGIETCSEIKCGEPRKSASLASSGTCGREPAGEAEAHAHLNTCGAECGGSRCRPQAMAVLQEP